MNNKTAIHNITAEPRYRDYVRRFKVKPGGPSKPMEKDEWEAKVLGKGKDRGPAKGTKPADADEPIRVPGGKDIGGIMTQWGSGGDIMNQVGTHLYGDHPMSKAKLQEALKEVQHLLGTAEAQKMGPSDVKDLTKVQKALSKAVGGGKAPSKAPRKTYKKTYAKPVTTVMDKYSLTDDDASEVLKFKKDKPRGDKVTDAELLRRFLAKAKPETKERMKGVSPAEFVKMLGAIMDEDEGMGKMAMQERALRSKIIRMAAANPEIREHLLPLLKD